MNKAGLVTRAVLMALLTIHIGCDSGSSGASGVLAPPVPQAENPRRSGAVRASDLMAVRTVAAKGRIQNPEYNPHLQDLIDQIIARGANSVDDLIALLVDETPVTHHVFDYWPKVCIGDIALVLLCDLFTDPSSNNATIPGADFDTLVERGGSKQPSFEMLRTYVAQHGRDMLQRKWAVLWERHRDVTAWDANRRCFRPAGQAATTNPGTQLPVAAERAQR